MNPYLLIVTLALLALVTYPLRHLARGHRLHGWVGLRTWLADQRGEVTLEDLETKRTELITRAKEIIERTEGAPKEDADVEALRSAATEVTELNEQITEAKRTASAVDVLRHAAELDDAAAEGARSGARPAVQDGQGQGDPAQTLGQLITPGQAVVGSDAYRGWMQRFPQGAPSSAQTVSSEAVNISLMRLMLGLQTPTDRMAARMGQMAGRAIVTAADTSAGDLVRPDFRGLLEPGLTRPLTIRDLVTVIPTTSDLIEYVIELSRENNAAPVAEASALTGDSGLKPEGGLEFDLRSAPVVTIAEWVAATKRIVADATGLRDYIEAYLTADLAEELEDQMLSGSGTGQNFDGILNVTTQNVGAPSATESVLHQIRKAKTLVRVNGQTRPTAVVVNPEDSELIDLLQINDEVNHFAGAGPFNYSENQPIWGLPRIESEAIAAGTFLVGDFRRAVLWDREDTNISVGTVDNDFIRNIVRLLAEMRAAFTVSRPAAFAKGSVSA